MRYFYALRLWVFLCTSVALAQLPKSNSSTEIYTSLQKLNFLGTALYVAAHPDDENTRLIAYLANEVKARTAYMSLTRGDGGQNLIGSELGSLLGVLRTQELLAARRIDGGEQFFSRAIDFGYSKHPEETLKIWNKEAILGDLVRVIREIQPDVIINRFDHRTPGTTHGHHTSSAMLSLEAFDLANDPKVYPEQLTSTEIWQPKRIFFNTSWWFYGSEEKFKEADKTNLLEMNVGVYYPIRGLSNNEIASLASSQHLCQGFGRLTTRGNEAEYVELLKGDMPADKTNIFEGINTTWSRIKGGEAIGKILYDIEANFDFSNPSKHVPQLVAAYALLQEITDTHWKSLKSKELEELIVATAGLYLDAHTSEAYATPGSQVKIHFEAVNRSNQPITLKNIEVRPSKENITINTALAENEKKLFSLAIPIPKNQPYTSPYWLEKKGNLGIFEVTDKSLIGKPRTPAAFTAGFELEINDVAIRIERPVIYRFAKPDKGEIVQSFEILPKATANIDENVFVFATKDAKEIPVRIKAMEKNLEGSVRLQLPKNWTSSPDKIDFVISQKGEERTVVFKLLPPEAESEGYIVPVISINGNTYSQSLEEITYDHIPKQTILLPSESKVVRLNIKKNGANIAYLMGAEDKVALSLEQIGYHVNRLDVNAIKEGSLDQYDAVVVGIRAYNVIPELKFKQKHLLEYVKNGGNLVLQYNVVGRSGFSFEGIAPYHLQLSNNRVTDENSPVELLAKDHIALNYPNKIIPSDFDGWVQERGLYLPNTWDERFTPLISIHDSGESQENGSILVTKYGKGNYVYTALSFFRELPEGVPGAYKLFTNLLSLPENKPTP
ncbi:PIG-L family deacetylase [Arenibacter sp. GZD96]|uniref:PIG-L family deacetylase n=1 Tax=Aurantibrevibacter litoralis TaxID=3106030 RepID=UPI002AFE07C5|nr:PIG-L family deacetylase [Arenibacter sp. GZD-96]MEA1786203.1 PIG-L family deacetylase [Arenibacter sp. GZD-96]